MTGTEFGKSILSLMGQKREDAILSTALNPANLPAWLRRKWAPVTVGPLTYYVSPDYFAIGTDDDYLRVAMTPRTAQAIASTYGAILPSRKMVGDIYRAAHLKLKSQPFPPDAKMETTQRMIDHDKVIGIHSPASLIAGHKKDIVVGPDLDGSKVAIYGWQPDPKVFPHQAYYIGHGSYYADYSHGVRLVSRNALLNGKPLDLVEAFRDPALVALVSDQGSFVPFFPSKGASWPSGTAGGGGGGVLAGAALGMALGGPVGAVLGGVAGAVLGKK